MRWARVKKILTPESYILSGNLYKVHHLHKDVMPSNVVQNSQVLDESCSDDAFLSAFVL